MANGYIIITEDMCTRDCEDLVEYLKKLEDLFPEARIFEFG